MSIIEYRKVKCYNCGKEETLKDKGSYPSHGLEISMPLWMGSDGRVIFQRDV